MKILFTQESFPPDIIGGAERLTLKIIESLKERGYYCEVLCTGNPNARFYKKIRTHRMPVNRFLMNLAFPVIAKHARNFDIIHTSSGNACYPSYIASKIVKRPVVCYMHHIFGENWIDIRGKITGNIFKKAEEFFLVRDYDCFVFQNELSKRLGEKMGISEKKSFLIQPGVDWDKFQIKNVKKEPAVLFVGNFRMDEHMVRIKGLEHLMEAARKLTGVKFYVVGEGKNLENLKKDASSNIIFTGPLRGEKLAEMYNKALVFCMPSLTEGFGLVQLEAMAAGCAIVSTVNIGQKGIMIRPKSSKDILKALSALLKNEKKTEKMGAQNRKVAKRFTWKKYIDNLEKIYDFVK